MTELERFAHRQTYDGADGRDRWTVRAVNGWVTTTVPLLLATRAPAGDVLDVGCGEQPFRALVERCGRRYVGMDVVQNHAGSVDVISTLEAAPSPTTGYAAILCTEVLEHVADVDAAFAGLRRLAAPAAIVAITVPFVFPLHMEPYDFRRLTRYEIARLAEAHRFAVEEWTPIGGATDVLATLVADTSILPASRSIRAKAKVALLRAGRAALVRALDDARLSRGVAINANTYLSNAVVLRAR